MKRLLYLRTITNSIILLAALLSFLPLSSLRCATYKIGIAISSNLNQFKIEHEINDIERDIYDGAALAVNELSGKDKITLSIPNFENTLQGKLKRLNNEPQLAASLVFALPQDTPDFLKALRTISHPVLSLGSALKEERTSNQYYQLAPDNSLEVEAMINSARINGLSERIAVIVLDTAEAELNDDLATIFSAKNIPMTLIHSQQRIKRLDLRRMKIRIVQKIERANPTAIFLLGNSEDVVDTAIDLRELKIQCPLYIRMRNTTRKVQNKLYNLGEIYGVTAASNLNRLPGEPGFVNRFARFFGRDPSSWAALAYDGIKQIVKGASRSNGSELKYTLPSILPTLPLEFGTGFAIDLSRRTVWYPATSKLEKGNFQVKTLPGRSVIEGSNLNKQVSPSPVRVEAPQRRRGDNRDDITQTGTVRRWKHILVLPE